MWAHIVGSRSSGHPLLGCALVGSWIRSTAIWEVGIPERDSIAVSHRTYTVPTPAPLSPEW